jgi:hypothetical protein
MRFEIHLAAIEPPNGQVKLNLASGTRGIPDNLTRANQKTVTNQRWRKLR